MSTQPLQYVCLAAPKPLSLDGFMSDPQWNIAEWTPEFVDIEGDLKPLPRYKTRAKMLWDNSYFYVAAKLEEPHIWATLTEHDSVIFQDNDFEVFIDPDGDAARYFEFEINALNTTWDLYLPKAYRDGGSADNSWEIPGMIHRVGLNGTLNDPSDIDDSWIVELAFPWAAFAEQGGMPCPPAPGDTWRVNFSRVQWQLEVINGVYQKVPDNKEDNWVWSPQGVIDMHQPEQWGYVTFAG